MFISDRSIYNTYYHIEGGEDNFDEQVFGTIAAVASDDAAEERTKGSTGENDKESQDTKEAIPIEKSDEALALADGPAEQEKDNEKEAVDQKVVTPEKDEKSDEETTAK